MDALDRLYRKLLDVRPPAAPEGGAQGITIAEVYQQLVPYRLIRGELGFSELKEYEHALLRLLAGERGYVRVSVPNIAAEFRRELRSPNPILGIYRDYAAIEVEVREPAAAALAAPEPRAEVDRQNVAGPVAARKQGREAPPDVTIAAPAPAEPQRTEPEAWSTPRREAERTTSPALRCWSCREPLPTGVPVRFCPQCGVAQVAIPCLECAAALQPAWKFCVQCGAARPPGSASPRSA